MEVFWTKRCQYIVAVAAAELQQIFPMNHKIIIQVYSLCHEKHYNDAIMGAIASQITSLTIVYSNDYSDADQKKNQSSASLAFVRGIHRWPVNSPHK